MRRVLMLLLLILGVFPLLLLNVYPFNNLLVSLAIWCAALLVAIPEPRESKLLVIALLALVVGTAFVLPRAYQRQAEIQERLGRHRF